MRLPDSSEERDALSYNLSDLKAQVEELHKILAVKEDEIAQLRKRNDKMAQSIEKSHASEGAGSFQAAADYMHQRDKKAIEESLRAEILANEEQRNYIEVLKQALEAKIEDLGFAEMLSNSKGRGKNKVDLFAELTNVKLQADFYRKKYMKFEGTVADHEGNLQTLQQRISELTQKN